MKVQTPLLALSTLALANPTFAAGGYAQPPICDRACWGAGPPQCFMAQLSTISRAVIHHTAGSTDYSTTSLDTSKAKVRAIQNYHMDVNGWCDIGYHFLTDKLGNAFEGRAGSLLTMPRGAHDGVNQDSIGVAMMGYFHPPYKNKPTLAHRCITYRLIAWKVEDPFDGFDAGPYGSLSSVGFLAGHRDVSATACPGDKMYSPYITTSVLGAEARVEVNAFITTHAGIACGAAAVTAAESPDPLSAIGDADEAAEIRWSAAGDRDSQPEAP